MSVAEAAHRPRRNGRAVKLWLGFLLVIAAGVALAWLGVQSLSGRIVQVETVQAGSGPQIKPQDGVLIAYEGRLENGTVFDSSQGAPVPLIASQTIPGFAQALSKMQKGGRYRVQIPSRLAYGSTPPQGGPIPPDADLTFDIHVVDIAPNAGLMQSQQPQQ